MGSHVITLPKWILVLRVFQLLFAVIILGISAYGLYWIAFNSWGFALFTSIATMIIVLYGVLTTRITTLQKAYNYWAIIVLEAIAVVFWLASMGALAATRAIFTVPTTINGCVNEGNGGVCYKKRDLNLSKRGYVATNAYLGMMSGAAGLSAIEMLLFIATLTTIAINLKRHRSSTKSGGAGHDKLESHPMTAQPYDQGQYQPQYQNQNEYQSQNQYQDQSQNQNQNQNQYWSQYPQQPQPHLQPQQQQQQPQQQHYVPV